MKKKRKIKWKIWILVAVVLILAVACAVYVLDYYHSQDVSEYLTESDTVAVSEIAEGWYFDGAGTEDAVVFYPGAKVEATAYAPLLYQLAEQGVDCFLVKMPANLAFFGKNRASDLMEAYAYENWYLAGHSLGGAMAAIYASEHEEALDGLIFLAAYSTKDLTDAEFPVLSLYGSEDGVLHMEKVEEGRKLMPSDYTEICVEGGNHAGFGAYGPQDGDGEASLSREDQWERTAEEILKMIN